jgi:hypothetical protein
LIFISYRREDSAGYAGRLHESLEQRLGEGEVFRDVDALEPGEDFVRAIAARLHDCRACLVLVGREWLNATDVAGRRRLDQDGDYVRLEIAAALARPDVLVIPVLVEGVAMPAAEDLPDAIRALSHRQAVSLRDETWSEDVDRLARTIRKAIGDGPAVRETVPASDARPVRVRVPPSSTVKWAVLAATVLAVILLARIFQGGNESPKAPPTPEAAVASDGTAAAAVEAPASAIAMPRLVEIAHGNLIYTLLAGDVAPRGNGRALRLRVRVSNEGSYPANFWDDSFRLAVPGRVLGATSGLNEVVAGHAVQQGVVSFDVPADATGIVLRVSGAGPTAELPLVLTSTGNPTTVDVADTSDVLSRAVVTGLVRDARPLVTGREISYTLVWATARRFVNVLRIVANVRVTNHGRYPFLFGSDAVRLVADNQPTAPFEGPNEVVAADSAVAANIVFDVTPSTRQAILRVSGESVAEMPFDLPAPVR